MTASFKVEDGNLMMTAHHPYTMLSRENLGIWLLRTKSISFTCSHGRSQPVVRIGRLKSNQLCPVCNRIGAGSVIVSSSGANFLMDRATDGGEVWGKGAG